MVLVWVSGSFDLPSMSWEFWLAAPIYTCDAITCGTVHCLWSQSQESQFDNSKPANHPCVISPKRKPPIGAHAIKNRGGSWDMIGSRFDRGLIIIAQGVHLWERDRLAYTGNKIQSSKQKNRSLTYLKQFAASGTSKPRVIEKLFPLSMHSMAYHIRGKRLCHTKKKPIRGRSDESALSSHSDVFSLIEAKRNPHSNRISMSFDSLG